MFLGYNSSLMNIRFVLNLMMGNLIIEAQAIKVVITTERCATICSLNAFRYQEVT